MVASNLQARLGEIHEQGGEYIGAERANDET
jgi:hypothetical protein